MRKHSSTTSRLNSNMNLAINRCLLALYCLAGLQATAGWSLPLTGTMHADGRDTARVVIPAVGEAPAVGNTRTGAEAFLRQHQAEFKLPADLSNLELVRARESLLGTHYRYRQLLNGVPIEGAEVVVSIRHDNGEVYQAVNDSYPVTQQPAAAKNVVGSDAALDAAWNHLRVHGKLLHEPRASLVYLPEDGGFRLAYKTYLAVEAPFGHWEHKVDALSGKVLSVRDTAVRLKREPVALPKFSDYNGPVWSRLDATWQWQADAQSAAAKTPTRASKNVVDGTAKVFDADPRTYLNTSSLLDSSAASSFTTAYLTRTLKQISENNGIYTLDGPWVVIVDFEAPTAAPSTTTTGNWIALRGNNAFNDAMTYFHIDQNQRYLQSLGYVGVRGIQYGPIQVDSNGVNGDDNSYFLPGQNQLSFGHGGVDDNEDADVILHEYGHAITHDIIPGWGAGDTGAIGEGFGDYWGGSYSSTALNGKVFHPEWAFSWDGHTSDTWPGRFLDKTNLVYDPTHTYQDHETISGVANYSDQLWSAPLWAAFKSLTGAGYARTNIDKILIESFFGSSSSPRMRDLATIVVNTANQLFPAGPYAGVFREAFVNQNIFEPPVLPTPVLLAPLGGESYQTGSVIQISWDRQGAPATAAARVEYSAGILTNFSDRMESGINGWVVTRGAGSVNWAQVTSSSHSSSHSWFVPGTTVVSDAYLRSPVINVTAGATLSFWHRYDFEAQFDGGVVEITTDGSIWVDIGALATLNGYNSTISTGYQSPIAARPAFTGTQGAYIQTVIPLTAYAGRSVYIRFRSACDNSTGQQGWWVDDVNVLGEWIPITTTAAGASSANWTAPMQAGANYMIRVQQFAAGFSPSTWATSGQFALVARPTPNPFSIQNVVLNNNSATVNWSSDPGVTYRVQFKSDPADANWSNLAGDVLATGSTSTKVDPGAVGTKRFYRVIVP